MRNLRGTAERGPMTAHPDVSLLVSGNPARVAETRSGLASSIGKIKPRPSADSGVQSGSVIIPKGTRSRVPRSDPNPILAIDPYAIGSGNARAVVGKIAGDQPSGFRIHQREVGDQLLHQPEPLLSIHCSAIRSPGGQQNVGPCVRSDFDDLAVPPVEFLHQTVRMDANPNIAAGSAVLQGSLRDGQASVRERPARGRIIGNLGDRALVAGSAVGHPDVAIQVDRGSTGAVRLVGGQTRHAPIGAAQAIDWNDAVVARYLVAGLGIKLGDGSCTGIRNPGEVKGGAVVAEHDAAIGSKRHPVAHSAGSAIQGEVSREGVALTHMGIGCAAVASSEADQTQTEK